MFNLKVFILINNQLLSTANAKDFNTDYYCFDFRTEVTDCLCSGSFFSSDKFRLFNKPFLTGFFKYDSKIIPVLSLNILPVIIFRKVMGV